MLFRHCCFCAESRRHIIPVSLLIVMTFLIAGCAHFRTTPEEGEQKEEMKRISQVFIRPDSDHSSGVQSAVKNLTNAFQRFNDIQVNVVTTEKSLETKNAKDAYTIYVGMTPPGLNPPLNFGEGGYVTQTDAAFIFWDNRFVETFVNVLPPVPELVPAHPAIEAFLARECGVYRLDPSTEGLLATKDHLTVPSEKNVRHISPGQRGAFREPSNSWTQEKEGNVINSLVSKSPQGFRYHAKLDKFRMLSFYQLLPAREEPDSDIDCVLPPCTGIPLGAAEAYSRRFTPGRTEKVTIEGEEIDTYTTFSHYVVLRKILDPKAKYESLLREYTGYYGAAAKDIRQYLKHWQKVFDSQKTGNALRLGNLTSEWRKPWLLWFYDNLENLTKPDDFRKARQILENAATKDLNRLQKKRLDRLMLHFEHTRLTYNTLRMMNQEDPGRKAMEAAIEKAQALLSFRRRFTSLLQTNPVRLTRREISCGDVAGLRFSQKTQKLKPLRKLSARWFVQPGSQEKGVSQEWFTISHENLDKWEEHKIPTTPWEGKSFPKDLKSDRLPSELWMAKALDFGKEVRKEEDIYVALRGVSGKCSFYWDGKLLENVRPDSERNGRTVLFKIAQSDVRNEKPYTFIVNWRRKKPFESPWRDIWIMAEKSDD